MPRDWSGAYTKPAAHWPLNPTSSTSLVGTSRSLLVGAARFTQRLLEWAGLPVRVRAEKANCRELGAAARALGDCAVPPTEGARALVAR